MKCKTRFIATFHGTDLAICSHSKERKIPSYSGIRTVHLFLFMFIYYAFCFCFGFYGSYTEYQSISTFHCSCTGT